MMRKSEKNKLDNLIIAENSRDNFMASKPNCIIKNDTSKKFKCARLSKQVNKSKLKLTPNPNKMRIKKAPFQHIYSTEKKLIELKYYPT